MARTTSTTSKSTDEQATGTTQEGQGAGAPAVDATLAPDVHQVDTLPDGRAERSAAAPGIRTEAEVVADAIAAAETVGKTTTADPAVQADVTRTLPDVQSGGGELVKFTRADGVEFEADEGSATFHKMLLDPDFARA